jgi:hypothetical protein
MRILAYFFILLGLVLLIRAARSENSGVSRAIGPGAGITYLVERREIDPKAFRALMNYQWIESTMPVLIGIVILGLLRRQEKLEPFSVDFAGTSAIDDLEKTLNEKEHRDRLRDR